MTVIHRHRGTGSGATCRGVAGEFRGHGVGFDVIHRTAGPKGISGHSPSSPEATAEGATG